MIAGIDTRHYSTLVGKAQAIVDLYERHPDLGFARLKAAVAEFEAATRPAVDAAEARAS